MFLTDRLPASIGVRLTTDHRVKRLRALFHENNKILREWMLNPDEADWDKYNSNKKELYNKIRPYNIRFRHYFEKCLRQLEDNERNTLYLRSI